MLRPIANRPSRNGRGDLQPVLQRVIRGVPAAHQAAGPPSAAPGQRDLGHLGLRASPVPRRPPLYAGGLPFAIGPLSDELAGHDVALVVGAPASGYYRYVVNPYLPPARDCCTSSSTPPRPALRRSATAWSAAPSYPWPPCTRHGQSPSPTRSTPSPAAAWLEPASLGGIALGVGPGSSCRSRRAVPWSASPAPTWSCAAKGASTCAP